MATQVNNGNEGVVVAPGAAVATNDEAGFTSFATFEAEMAKEDNTGGAATIQNDGAVRDASQIKPPEEAPAQDAAPDDADDTDATDDTPPPVTGEPTKGPKKVNLKERLGQLTRERHEADARERAALQRAEDAEARAAELEANSGKPTAKAGPKTDQPAPITAEGKPQPEDFEFGEYDPEYQEALVDWRVEQALAKKEAKQAAQTQAEAARAHEAELTQKWGGVIEKGAAANPDFEDKVLKGTNDWKLSKHLWELSVDSEVGHDVLYHLASNPAESARIFNLPLTRQAVEFGKLEVRFSQPSGDSPKAGSKDGAAGHMPSAPKPMAQVRGAGGQFKPDAGTKDFAAFEAMMKAEEASRAKP